MGVMIRSVPAYLVLALMGVVVAGVGAASHRAYGWIGVALCLLMVATASVFARAWKGLGGLAAFGALWAAATMVLAMVGPGGSILIEQDAVGLTWVYGGAGIIALTAIPPRRLFEGTP